MGLRGIFTGALVGLALTGCSTAVPPAPITPAPKPQAITLVQALGCGPQGLVPEVHEPLYSRPDWTTPAQAAAGMGGPDGRPVTARRWSEISSLTVPFSIGHSEPWIAYDAATQLPLSLVAVSKFGPDIVSGTADGPVAVGQYGGGIVATCQR